jgi:peptidoglycan/LPS O-acetylase OafA/YrhL
MAGCLLRLAWVRYPALFRDKSRAVASYLIGTAIFMYLLSLPITNYGQQVYWYTTTLAWGMACCFVLAGLGGADWLWRASWLRFIGRHSYGIYLLHHPLVLVMFFLSKGHPTWLFWIYIPLAIGAGVISTMTVEKYFLEMRKRLCP